MRYRKTILRNSDTNSIDAVGGGGQATSVYPFDVSAEYNIPAQTIEIVLRDHMSGEPVFDESMPVSAFLAGGPGGSRPGYKEVSRGAIVFTWCNLQPGQCRLGFMFQNWEEWNPESEWQLGEIIMSEL